MSATLQTEIANEALALSHQFRENLALKHGLPKPNGPQRVSLDQPYTAAPAASGSPSPGATVPATAKVDKSLVSRVAPWLLTAAIGGPLGALAYSALTKDTPVVEQPKDGSLLQYLEDQGFHLPEGDTWK